MDERTLDTVPRITARQIAVNSLSGSGAQLGGLVITFLLLPFLIHSLGTEVYGLWAVIGSIIGYIGLLDFGVGSGFVKFLAEYVERDEKAWARQVMTFGVLFYFGLGLSLLPIAYLLAPHVLAILKLAPRYHVIAMNLFLLIYGYFFIMTSVSVIAAMVIALQRMDLASAIGMAAKAIYAVSVMVLIDYGYGVYSIPYAMFIGLGAGTIMQLVIVYRLFGSPWSNILSWNPFVLRQLFAFGGWMQITAISQLINLETDRIILGAFVGVSSVTWYEVGSRLALLTRLPIVLLGALLPAASAFDARSDSDSLNTMYIHGSRYLALLSVAICGLVVGAGARLEQVWMGQSYPYVTLIAVVLAVSYTVVNLTGVGTTIIRATGQPRYETYYAVLSSVLNVAITLALTPRFGMLGVIVGTAVGCIGGSLYFLCTFHTLRNMSWWTSMGSWLFKLVTTAILASGALWVVCNSLSSEVFAPRLRGCTVLAALGGAYVLTLAGLLWLAGFWEPRDAHLLLRVLPVKTMNRL
jgi:O-antigen/teichoic acid export membrane protein